MIHAASVDEAAANHNSKPQPYLSPEELRHLTPGVLDDAAVEFFANGHCASMALAVHRLAGWPMLGVDGFLCGGWERVLHHAVVESPRGLLDAAGIHRKREYVKCLLAVEGCGCRPGEERNCGDVRAALVPLSEDSLRYADRHVELVFPFAQALLARHFPKGWWRRSVQLPLFPTEARR